MMNIFSKNFLTFSAIGALTAFSANANSLEMDLFGSLHGGNTSVQVKSHHEAMRANFLPKTARGRNVKVIVVDNYIDSTHKDFTDVLTNSTIPGAYENGMAEGHGTHVAGIIHGLAPEAMIKFISRYELDSNGKHIRTDATVVRALQEAARSEGDIVNLSFGLGQHITPQFKQALQDIVDSGKVISLAYGNDFDKFTGKSTSLQFLKLAEDPRFKGMIRLVSAVDAKDRLAHFSNRAIAPSKYSIATPGVDILAAFPGQTYKAMSGTSMASPAYVGALAKLKSAFNGKLNIQECIELVDATSRKTSMSGSYIFNSEYGHGVVDLKAAYEAGLQKIAERQVIEDLTKAVILSSSKDQNNEVEDLTKAGIWSFPEDKAEVVDDLNRAGIWSFPEDKGEVVDNLKQAGVEFVQEIKDEQLKDPQTSRLNATPYDVFNEWIAQPVKQIVNSGISAVTSIARSVGSWVSSWL